MWLVYIMNFDESGSVMSLFLSLKSKHVFSIWNLIIRRLGADFFEYVEIRLHGLIRKTYTHLEL
jgi:hypothetical protein